MNKKFIILLKICCIYIFLHFITGYSCTGEANSVLSIRVYDEITKQPIEGVNVSFIMSEKRMDVRYTDKKGCAFTIWTGAAWDVPVKLSKQGYQNKEIIVHSEIFDVDSGDNAFGKMDVYLTPVE